MTSADDRKVFLSSQSMESFSPNQIREKIFSYESGSIKEGKSSEKSDTSSNDSSQSFHVNHHEGLSMATNNSQENSFNQMNNLYSVGFRQHEVNNNPLGGAMVGGEECIYQEFSTKNIQSYNLYAVVYFVKFIRHLIFN